MLPTRTTSSSPHTRSVRAATPPRPRTNSHRLPRGRSRDLRAAHLGTDRTADSDSQPRTAVDAVLGAAEERGPPPAGPERAAQAGTTDESACTPGSVLGRLAASR